MHYAYMSAGIEKLFGLPVKDILADPDVFSRLIVEEDRPRIASATEKSARELTPFDCELRQRTVTGEIKWVQCRSMPHLLEDGSILWDGVVDQCPEACLPWP
jgi:PAS domain-containing protein